MQHSITKMTEKGSCKRMAQCFSGCGFRSTDIILLTIFVLCGLFYLTELYLFWRQGPKSFAVRLDSFSVENMTLKNLVSAELTIGNKKRDVDIEIRSLKSIIHYNKTPLSCSSTIHGFHLRPASQRQVVVPFQEKRCGGLGRHMENRVVEEFRVERKNGNVNLSFRVVVEAAFRRSVIWYFSDYYYFVCEDIKLKFKGSEVEGRIQTGPYLCKVVSKN